MLDRFHETFLAAAAHKNYSKAAEVLHLTQPAVSQHIKALEARYGFPLFLREGRRLFLSDQGKILKEYVTKASDLDQALRRELDNSSSLVKRLHVGATLTIGEYVLPSILGDYKQENPYTDIILQVENTRTITRKLFENQLDLGFVEGHFDPKMFESRLYRKDPLVLIASPDSTLADRQSIEPEELYGLKLILREQGSGTRQTFEEGFRDAGFDTSRLNLYMSIGSLTTIKSMVARNLGFTLISRLAVERELAKGILKEIKIRNCPFEREFNFIFRKSMTKEYVFRFINFCLP